ncbi:MAG: DUF4367 domain-containing protein [Firmicutes bacterium]|nr:DUF4367 domain-containing protein [Bacillota bacterium]
MSDKNRNMDDINDQKTIDRTEQAALDQTAEQQAFSEEIRRRLAAPDSGKPTLEEFKVMVYKDREKRRKKRNALVACIVAAFIVGYLSFDALVPEVGADKNPKETIVTEDGVIIEDGGWGSSEEEDNVWCIYDWSELENVKLAYPMMVVPKYIPKGFVFVKFTLERLDENNIICEYHYNNKKKDQLEMEVFIHNNAMTSTDINNIERVLSSEKGDIYIQEKENKIATIQINGSIVNIVGNITDNEIMKVVNGL